MVKPVHTLGDARDVGLEIVAVCRNILCRRRTTLDIRALIYKLGEGRPLLPERGKRHFSETMRCSVCGGQGAFIWPQEEKGAEPTITSLPYSINEWYGGNSTPIKLVAATGHVEVAHAAFHASVAAYPGRRITLQQRALVIEDSRFQVVRGGKA